MNIDWCKNFNGIINPICRAGVPYLTFGPIPTKSRPCHREGGGSCIYREMPTQQEVDDWRKTMDESLARTLEIVGSIPPGQAGSMACPNCGKTIHWARSPRNNHLHAKCETPGCFAVLQ